MKTPPIFLKDVQFDSEKKQFSGKTVKFLAGRCLLDALEFLRIDPKWHARFGQLMNAHAIRLCWQYTKDLDQKEVQARIRSLIESTYVHILDGRNDSIPFFGDDFWDWAYILDAQLTVVEDFSDAARKQALLSDLRTFYQEVKAGLGDGLALNKPGEWFGPAMPTAAFRLLKRSKSLIDDGELEATLERLKKLALTPIRRGKYLSRDVKPDYHQWHLGQVAAEFPERSKSLKKELGNLKAIGKLTERTSQVYALARVIQGAVALKDVETAREALNMLYECEDLSRPLGTGIVGDHIKASLNTLEAIWEVLSPVDRGEVKSMLDALLSAHRRLNRIGFLVAIGVERDACIEQFKLEGASIEDEGGVVNVEHQNYRVAIISGKALIAATEATGRLIHEYRVTSAVMVGIAGSLGRDVNGCFDGPTIGDVVLGTSSGAYRVREKVRETVTDAPVPWAESTWAVIPTDPTLFSLAHRIARGPSHKHVKVHEGLIVTGNGIKDNPQEKAAVRDKLPGGLAVAEEGFALALGCLQHNIPQIEIRGISDLAQGDKERQGENPEQEHHDQELAARNAARLAVALVNSLSEEW